MAATVSELLPERDNEISSPFSLRGGSEWSNRSVAAIERAPGQTAAMASLHMQTFRLR
jgi:hypothetical protein